MNYKAGRMQEITVEQPRMLLTRPKPVKCPVCRGLECLCRPRFFSGQLLTESELNAEQEYVIKKNRLHNLYLHGWGVVCGLELTCHPSCKGWIRITEGYAIAPCGDDIVLCKDVDFPLVDRIEQCLQQQRKQQDCAPYAAESADCGTDGCWYVTVAYDEQSTRAMASLRADLSASFPSCTCGSSCSCGGSCGCGCGGTGGATHYPVGSTCGCGCGQTKTANGHNGTNGKATTMRTPLNVPCEPTRICEGYKIDICRVIETRENCEDALSGTILGRIYDCILEAQELVRLAPQSEDDLTDLERYSQCCSYVGAVRDYFATHRTTRCELLARLGALNCPKPGVTWKSHHLPADEHGLVGGEPVDELGFVGGRGDYADTVDTTVAAATEIVAACVLDCICLDLLPPCPADPGDDRLILGEVCVQDGEIVEICNMKDRRQVVTWPAVRYWLSVLPIEKLIAEGLERLCCGEPGRWLQTLMIDRSWNRGGRLSDQPCDPRVLFEAVALLFSGVSTTTSTGEVRDMQLKAPFTVGHLLGGDPDAAVKELEGQGAVATVVTQDVPGPLALLFRLRPQPTINPGTHVQVIESGGRVIGFNVDARATMADVQSRVARIEQQVGGEG
jgi:hypothetical protein